MSEMVKKKAIKAYISAQKMSSDTYIDKIIEIELRPIIDRAMRRAKENNRNTVLARDF